jgi:ATP adenylyltransferase
MVVPYRQVGDLQELTVTELTDLMQLVQRCQHALREVMKPEGFNIGLNLGRCAGAGITNHLHFHVVPRWNGDTNFMPVLAGVGVVPQALTELAGQLRHALASLGRP